MPPVPAIPFPAIDPVLIEAGPFTIRWYALAYVGGLLAGWWLVARMAARPPAPFAEPVMTRAQVDDFLLWATLGVILGGRFGYVLFYQPGWYLAHPLQALAVWQGGMSFHGGLLGVTLAIVWFCRRRGVPVLALADMLAVVAPIGLFLGRLANFVNGELYGRPADVPWAMVFPGGGPEPRHPSQLYEAGLEGVVLFAVLYAMMAWGARARRGLLTGVFLAGYGVARSVAELFREPDPFLGYFLGGTTMGQWLSVPLVIIGAWLIQRARAAPSPDPR